MGGGVFVICGDFKVSRVNAEGISRVSIHPTAAELAGFVHLSVQMHVCVTGHAAVQRHAGIHLGRKSCWCKLRVASRHPPSSVCWHGSVTELTARPVLGLGAEHPLAACSLQETW